MTIQAKAVINKKFWILQDQAQKKIGNIEQDGNQYRVKIEDHYTYFKNIASIKTALPDLVFEKPVKTAKKPASTTQCYDFDVGCRVYNPIYDVSRGLPIFTKTAKSRSYYAAGWYALRQGAEFEVVRNPKVILIQRYEYRGPFHDQQSAKTAASAV